MRHQLNINSLNDAQAGCRCLKWSLVQTGAMTREEIVKEYNAHLKKGQKANRKAREQAYEDCGMVKVKGALGGIYWE